MSRIAVPENAREITAEEFAKPSSSTAANRHNRLFKESGAMDYRVMIGIAGGGLSSVIVNAVTGDEAAAGALARNPGWKVVNVSPASDPVEAFRLTDDLAVAQ